VYSVKEGTKIKYDEIDSIKHFITSRGHNYVDIETIKFLAQGGESYVLRMEVKQPVELIAKMILPKAEYS
jgi:hypothetical protein